MPRIDLSVELATLFVLNVCVSNSLERKLECVIERSSISQDERKGSSCFVGIIVTQQPQTLIEMELDLLIVEFFPRPPYLKLDTPHVDDLHTKFAGILFEGLLQVSADRQHVV